MLKPVLFPLSIQGVLAFILLATRIERECNLARGIKTSTLVTFNSGDQLLLDHEEEVI